MSKEEKQVSKEVSPPKETPKEIFVSSTHHYTGSCNSCGKWFNGMEYKVELKCECGAVAMREPKID